MKIDTDTVVSMTDANQNFSKVVRVKITLHVILLLISRLLSKVSPQQEQKKFCMLPVSLWICMMKPLRNSQND